MAVLFEKIGWSQSFMVTGIVGTATLLFILLFFKDTPEQAGRVAYGARSSDKSLITSGNIFVEFQSEFQGFVYKTNAFWNLINIHFLGCVGHAVILVGIIPLAMSKGLGPINAAGILTTISIVSIVTRFIAPVLSERYGSKIVMFFSFFGQGIGVFLLFTAGSTWEFYLFAVVWAIPYGGEGTVFPVINRQYYGHSPMGANYGWQLLGAGLGMALGGLLPGLIFDITGGYAWAIGLSAAFSLAGAAAILFLEPTNRQLIPDWPEVESDHVTAGASPVSNSGD
jgi:MFS family permease